MLVRRYEWKDELVIESQDIDERFEQGAYPIYDEFIRKLLNLPLANEARDLIRSLSPRQHEAIIDEVPGLIVTGGPGTGKTAILAHRLVAQTKRIIESSKVIPKMLMVVQNRDSMLYFRGYFNKLMNDAKIRFLHLDEQIQETIRRFINELGLSDKNITIESRESFYDRIQRLDADIRHGAECILYDARASSMVEDFIINCTIKIRDRYKKIDEEYRKLISKEIVNIFEKYKEKYSNFDENYRETLDNIIRLSKINKISNYKSVIQLHQIFSKINTDTILRIVKQYHSDISSMIKENERIIEELQLKLKLFEEMRNSIKSDYDDILGQTIGLPLLQRAGQIASVLNGILSRIIMRLVSEECKSVLGHEIRDSLIESYKQVQQEFELFQNEQGLTMTDVLNNLENIYKSMMSILERKIEIIEIQRKEIQKILEERREKYETHNRFYITINEFILKFDLLRFLVLDFIMDYMPSNLYISFLEFFLSSLRSKHIPDSTIIYMSTKIAFLKINMNNRIEFLRMKSGIKYDDEKKKIEEWRKQYRFIIFYEDILALIKIFHEILEMDIPTEQDSKLVAIDEAHNLSELHFWYLRKLIPDDALITVSMDPAQSIDTLMPLSQEKIVDIMRMKDYKVYDYPVVYRNPDKVFQLASLVLGRKPQETLLYQRDNCIHIVNGSSPRSVIETILNHLNERGVEYNQICILCKTHEEAKDVNKYLRDTGIRVSARDIRSAIGLEYDIVIVWNLSRTNYPDTLLHRKLLYVAFTRTHFELYLHTPDGTLPEYIPLQGIPCLQALGS